MVSSQCSLDEILGELRLRMGEGVTGWVAEHKAVVALAANASADARFKRFQGLVEDTCEAFLSVPLVSGGEVIGVAVAKAHLAEENARLQEETLEMKRQLDPCGTSPKRLFWPKTSAAKRKAANPAVKLQQNLYRRGRDDRPAQGGACNPR